MKQTILIWMLFILASEINSQVSINATHVKCKGSNDGSLTVSVENASLPIKSYSWSDGASTSGTRNKIAAGEYCVTVTDNANCTGTACITVEEPASKLDMELAVSADPTIAVRCGDLQPVVVTKYVSGGVPPYTGGSTQVLRVSQSGKFKFSTTDNRGCKIEKDIYALVMPVDCPGDPNDITGEQGIKEEKWVSVKDTLNYRIRFENDSTLATSPAQRVYIEVSLHPNADPRTFRLGDFGFRNLVFDVPENSPFYQTRLNLTNQSGVWVDVIAGINVQTLKAFWIFESIDPTTGILPLNPQVGFLPVNNNIGDGEGFVNFYIKPKPINTTGNFITEKANIVFDVEQNIETNVWSNKIDAFPPITFIEELPDSIEDSHITIHFTRNDDIGGTGVRYSTLWYSKDNHHYQLFQDYIIEDSVSFWGIPGEDYYFKIVSTDSVGNRESKTLFDEHIFFREVPLIKIIHNYPNTFCDNDSITLDIKSTRVEKVDVIIQNMSNSFSTLWSENIDTSLFPINLVLPDSLINQTIQIILKNHNGSEADTTAPLIAFPLPQLNGSNDTLACPGETLLLQKSGVGNYKWYNSYNLELSTQPFIMVNAQNNTFYSIVGTDFNGCTTTDTIHIELNPTSKDTLVISLCEGDSVLINGNYENLAGYYEIVFVNSYGCDSIIVYNIQYQNPCIWSGGNYVYVDIDATGTNSGMNWNNAFNNLQDALYIAGRYENVKEVWVASGTYKPSISNRDTSFVLKDSIKIFGGFIGVESDKSERSLNADLVKLSGDLGIPSIIDDNSIHVVLGLSSCQECVLDGLTIQYGNANIPAGDKDKGAGIFNLGKLQLHNVILERNDASNEGAAILALNANSLTQISGCVFRLNISHIGKDIVFKNGALIEFSGANVIME